MPDMAEQVVVSDDPRDRVAVGSAVLTILGGVLIVVGSLLPWASFDSFLNVFSVNAIDSGAGLVTVPLGGLIAGLGIARLLGRTVRPRYLVLAAAIVLLVVVIAATAYQLAIIPPQRFGWILLNSLGRGLAVTAAGAVLAGLAARFRGR
jgi:hypothetical protein